MVNCIGAKRKERGLSQIEFARAIGVDRVTVWRWENEDRDIPYDTLKLIAQFFEVAPKDIVPDFALVPTKKLDAIDAPTPEEVPLG